MTIIMTTLWLWLWSVFRKKLKLLFASYLRSARCVEVVASLFQRDNKIVVVVVVVVGGCCHRYCYCCPLCFKDIAMAIMATLTITTMTIMTTTILTKNNNRHDKQTVVRNINKQL